MQTDREMDGAAKNLGGGLDQTKLPRKIVRVIVIND